MKVSQSPPNVMSALACGGYACARPGWRGLMLHKALDNFLFGLTFGMGFAIAANVLHFLGQFIH